MLFDTHTHLHFTEFAADRDAVLERARAAGVRHLLTVGTDPKSSAEAMAMAEGHPGVYASVGIHPHDAGEADEAALAEVERLAKASPRVVAIGEIGLDYYRNLAPREVQALVFRRQLSLARQLRRPVLIHCREAHPETLEILQEGRIQDIGGIMHCFSGDEAMARKCLDLGLFISLAGPVTYPNARKLPEVAKLVPEDRLVVETDCPYLPPQPYRGKRNEPSYLPITAAHVAALRGQPLDAIGPVMSGNALALFRISDGYTERS